MVAILSIKREIPTGSLPIETISGELIFKEASKRGFEIRTTTSIS
jgi:hypothetical protein